MEFLVLHRSPDLTAWQVSQGGRNSVRREHLYSHLDQTEKGTGEIRSRPAAAIDEHSNPGDDVAVRARNVDHFLDLAAARHGVFRDNKSFVRRNGETTAKDGIAFSRNLSASYSQTRAQTSVCWSRRAH
jgi:hypothetical protein